MTIYTGILFVKPLSYNLLVVMYRTGNYETLVIKQSVIHFQQETFTTPSFKSMVESILLISITELRSGYYALFYGVTCNFNFIDYSFDTITFTTSVTVQYSCMTIIELTLSVISILLKLYNNQYWIILLVVVITTIVVMETWFGKTIFTEFFGKLWKPYL